MTPDPVPAALQIAVAWATVFGAVGVVAAVAAFFWQWRKDQHERDERAAQASLERERFEKQIDALERAENDRLAAQARRVVPTFLRASEVIPNLWHVRIDNWSTEVISALQVEVSAVDHAGNQVPGGCKPGDRIAIGEAMADVLDRTMKPTFDLVGKRTQVFFEQLKTGVIELGEDGAQFQAHFDHITEGMNISEQNAAILKEQVKQAIQVNLSDEWPVILSPGQWAARAFILASAELTPRAYIRFDEPAGYTWERTDITKPTRVFES